MSGLLTVLIAEKDHINAIQQTNKLFFEPFLENKELAFCYWNPAGQTLLDAVPGLLDAVGRQRNWRAVIINNCSLKTSKMRNPYDVVDFSALTRLSKPDQQPDPGESWDDWETKWEKYFEDVTAEKEKIYKEAIQQPLQKLSTWLCFRPEDYVLNDVQEKQDIHDWAMEMIGRDDTKPSAKLELLERAQYKRELRMKEHIRRDFVAEKYLSVAYPFEVHCISPRSAENNYFDPDAFWNVRQDSEYSTFADRNMFFDRMRFLVFDMLSHSHRNFRSDYIRFLATTLIFASNPIPGSAMQARRLYQLEVDTDDAPLCTLVTSYDRKLAATSDIIENEIDRIRSEIPEALSDKAAEALFCSSKGIDVSLDSSCDPEKVLVETDYGLFFDQPQDEYHRWSHDYHESEKALSYISKQRSRSVKKSVIRMHQSSAMLDIHASRLTPFQIDDIRDYTDAAEDEMIASIPSDFTDISTYSQQLTQEAEKVKKVLRTRMTRKTTMVLSQICLGLFFLCFLPFLVSNGGSPKIITTAIILTISMLGVLAAIMFISLFFLRNSVLKAVRAYNHTVGAIMDDIQNSLKRVSKYLSASANVRKGHAAQNYARKNLDEFTLSLRIRKKHQDDIRRRRAYLAEKYGDYFGDRSCCDEAMSRPYEYDFDQRTEYAYPAPFLAGDQRQIEFISNGNYVTVPSSYVTRILVRMEGIYER